MGGMENDVQRAARISCLAKRFRQGIIACGAELAGFTGLSTFPVHSCQDSSILLGEYLRDNGQGEWRSVFAGDDRHVWLEQGRIIVDITADQFPDVTDEVIVTTDRGWHRQFSPDPSRELAACIEIYDPRTREMLLAAYQIIGRRLTTIALCGN